MAAANKTLRLKDVDFSKLNFSDKRETKNPKGTDNVFLSYGDANEWLYIQFPQLRHPFDANANDDGSLTITLSFDKANPKHRVAIDKLRAFDDIIFKKLAENSQAWLKKPHLDDKWKSSDKFVPFLKIKEVENDDGEMEERYYNIKVKLPAKERKLTTVIYDFNMKEVDESFITPRCVVEAIARPARLWFQKTGKVGTTWECAFVRVKKNESDAAAEKLFQDDSDDESDAPKTVVNTEDVSEEPAKEQDNLESEKDDVTPTDADVDADAAEADDTDENTETTTVVPPKKGRKIGKKAAA